MIPTSLGSSVADDLVKFLKQLNKALVQVSFDQENGVPEEEHTDVRTKSDYFNQMNRRWRRENEIL
jgi:hypothetical protein